MRVSVVVPVHNGAATLADCLSALCRQSLPAEEYEIIVVDDGSTDATAEIASRFDVRVIFQFNYGAPAARNAGIREARGRWVAFTDADAIPSRGWLARLVNCVEDAEGNAIAFGAAGPIRGHDSRTPAARYVDLTGGLDAERHLAHPRFPFAPTGNVMYLRELLLEAGGFDERFKSYDACDLHLRLRQKTDLPFFYQSGALVLHRHRATWGEYWRQQHGYGIGYAQFVLKHRDKVYWGIAEELRSIAAILREACVAAVPAAGDVRIVRRGNLTRAAAQHLGFARTFFRADERRRWGLEPFRPAFRFGDLAAMLVIAWFVFRLPHLLERHDVRACLRILDRRRSGRLSLERVLRARGVVLRVLRRFDNCYTRAFTLYRFLAVPPQRIDLRLGVEPPRGPDGRIRGHAWVLLDGELLEGPEREALARTRRMRIPAKRAS